MGRKGFRAGYLVACVALVGLTACSAQYRNHGYVPDDVTLSQVTVGVDTRETVEELVGAPTTEGIQKDSSIYYVRSRVRRYAFYRPEVVSREVMALSFNSGGVLTNIETYALEDGHLVELTRRVTDSSTADKTFIRQLLGNLGRVDASRVLGGE
ncbi:outer membrane protein assembly factor BamE [Pseudooceanicola sp. HF7]|uniref:outer membrane protein assembly factor BamE n=1 Tax=Pseudooceanicola sp. HF7 TaxID=2721560 RepID=UPI0014303EA7|nr:outer membrane protein assembly factor BamE [Pseudooceanicola sp. HF7]NIZ08807.1 outer membrane protein assembly factor BamE [Pseudooceanicola sp. HF7]